MHSSQPLFFLTLCLVSSCANGTEDSRTDDLQVETTPPSVGVRFAHRRIVDQPALVRAGYTAGSIGAGCSGNFVGPNIFITAAHCGSVDRANEDEPVLMQFAIDTGRTDSNRLRVARTSVPCRFLYQIFVRPGSAQDQRGEDLAVLYCDSLSNGLDPGDVFGYLDIDGRSQVPDGAGVTYLFTSILGATSPTVSSVPGQHAQNPSSPGLTAPIVAGRTQQYGVASTFSTQCLRYETESTGSPGRILT